MSAIPMTDELRQRLTALRDDIAMTLAVENRDRQMIAEHALSELSDILDRDLCNLVYALHIERSSRHAVDADAWKLPYG